MRDDLKITDLRSFAASIRSAASLARATALDLSQPVVSQRIQRLEKIVGERLVVRDARGTRVTPQGEKLLAYAERILALHDEARSVLEEDQQPFAGKRSIGLLEDLAIAHLPAALADFARLHPGVELEVIVGPAAELRKRAERGELDLVLGDPDVMPESFVHWRKSFQLSWACAPSFDPAATPLPLVLFSAVQLATAAARRAQRPRAGVAGCLPEHESARGAGRPHGGHRHRRPAASEHPAHLLEPAGRHRPAPGADRGDRDSATRGNRNRSRPRQP